MASAFRTVHLGVWGHLRRRRRCHTGVKAPLSAPERLAPGSPNAVGSLSAKASRDIQSNENGLLERVQLRGAQYPPSVG